MFYLHEYHQILMVISQDPLLSMEREGKNKLGGKDFTTAVFHLKERHFSKFTLGSLTASKEKKQVMEYMCISQLRDTKKLGIYHNIIEYIPPRFTTIPVRIQYNKYNL